MSLLQKVNSSPRWPTVSATTSLPNVAGSPTQSSDLQVGDECYVAGTVNALYVCTTATVGAGAWVPYVQLAGQIGGTAASPDVRGLRETSGPTLLTLGAIADGQTLVRSGTAIVGSAVVAYAPGPYQLLWKWNQTDLTEFDQVGDVSFTYTVTTWGARNSNDDPTPAIRMDSPATSSGFSALLIKSALLPSLASNYRYLWVARMQNSTVAGTQDILVIPYYESPTYFIAAMRKTDTSQNYWTKREGSTTYTDLAALTASAQSGGANGRVLTFETLVSPASASQKPWVQGLHSKFDSAAFVNLTPAATRASYAPGWQSLGTYAPRIGFGMRSYGTATAGGGNCIADIALYKVT